MNFFPKRRKFCIICDKRCTEKQKNPSDETWKTFQENARIWKESEDDQYGMVFEKVDWESGAVGVFWHKDCKWSFGHKTSLSNALEKIKTKPAVESFEQEEKQPEVTDVVNFKPRETRNSFGVLNKKDSCIWCCKGM